jgi:hypothetical protein
MARRGDGPFLVSREAFRRSEFRSLHPTPSEEMDVGPDATSHPGILL